MHDLNASATKALKKFLVAREPQVDPALQLVSWALANRPNLVPYPASQFLGQLAEQLPLLGDQEAQRALVHLGDQEHLSDAQADVARDAGVSHQRLVTLLVENLYENLQEKIPSLRPPEASLT